MVRHTSLILLYDSKKKVLLQHKTKDAKALPDCWAFFGGGMEEGESPEEAVKREADEELEYDLIDPKLVLTQEFDDPYYGKGIKYIFIEEYDPKKKLILHEGKEFGWFRIKDTKALNIIHHDREALQKIKDKLDSA